MVIKAMIPLTVIMNEEELLENRLEFLQQKFAEPLAARAAQDPQAKSVAGGDVFTFLVNADPSPNKKFVQWLIGLYLKGNLMLEDVYKANEYLQLFLKNVKKLPGPMRDINRYKNINDLYDVIEQYEEVQTQSEINLKLDQKMHGPEHVNIIYNSPTMKVLQLKSKQAACYFGKNTKWCTAARNNNMYDTYAKQGPIFIVLVKKENVRFQLHFESNQFMNEKDQSVDMMELGDKYPELKKALGLLYNKAVVTQDPSNIFQLENPVDEVVETAFYRKPSMIKNISDPSMPMIIGAIKKEPEIIIDLIKTGVEVPDELQTYAVQQNFSLSRKIPKFQGMYEQAEEMNNDPDGLSLEEQAQRDGYTMEVLMRAVEAGDEQGLSLYGFDSTHGFFINNYYNRHEFISEWIPEDNRNNVAHWASSVLHGEGENIEIYEIPSDTPEIVLKELPKYRAAISQYILNLINDPDNQELLDTYEDFDPTNEKEIMSFLYDEKNYGDAEQIRIALVSASHSAIEYGIENEMANDFYRWFDSLEGTSPISVHVVQEKGVMVYVDKEEAIDILSKGINEQYPLINDWHEIAEFPNFYQPRYGWDGFSKEAAEERLYDELPVEVKELLDPSVREPF